MANLTMAKAWSFSILKRFWKSEYDDDSADDACRLWASFWTSLIYKKTCLYEYMGNLILSLAVAFVGHLLVEAPFANLERLYFSQFKPPPSKENPSDLCQVETEAHAGENEAEKSS
ncbi:uncharacterized protein TNCT_392321 [Trichonephila clavata]|uniref:Uncharacterized protein n=1 Tax=Trichonephila clavata TaxID=2740835 RepID=A0A8X6JQJ8_TRICU|nr:uncharacterized protein TNCT_392321 [Trichonephila clavata]